MKFNGKFGYQEARRHSIETESHAPRVLYDSTNPDCSGINNAVRPYFLPYNHSGRRYSCKKEVGNEKRR